jgi:Carboxypeptidase regulatory-like domain
MLHGKGSSVHQRHGELLAVTLQLVFRRNKMNVNFKTAFGSITAVLAMVALLSVCALAQRETGSISGTITDPSGAVIPGAEVTVKNTGTGAMRTTTTGATGGYTLAGLPPASYVLSVSAPGFAPYKQVVTVTVASLNTLNPSLEVAKAVGEIVEVTAGMGNVQVETQTAEISTMVNSQQVSELPSLTLSLQPLTVAGRDCSGELHLRLTQTHFHNKAGSSTEGHNGSLSFMVQSQIAPAHKRTILVRFRPSRSAGSSSLARNSSRRGSQCCEDCTGFRLSKC